MAPGGSDESSYGSHPNSPPPRSVTGPICERGLARICSFSHFCLCLSFNPFLSLILN